MKWKVTVGALIIVMGIFASYLWSHEKQVNPQQEKAGAAPAQKPQTRWENIGPGVKVLRLWTTTGPKRPQIAVLELSKDEYQDLKKDPSAFVNSKHIFPKDVQPGASVTEVELPPADYQGGWSAVCVHTMTSRMVVISSIAEEGHPK